jgi:hypothetical protein
LNPLTRKEASVQAQPQPEHQWLQKLVGEWSYEHEADSGPDKPKQKFTGTERVRSLGGLWTLGEGTGAMPGGGTANTLMTLGYDPDKKRFVGTWVGSMMSFLWVYDGSLDPAGRTLTLNAEGPDFSTPGKTAKYQDIIEFVSDDHRVLRSQTLGDDGTWHPFMEGHYRRTR